MSRLINKSIKATSTEAKIESNKEQTTLQKVRCAVTKDHFVATVIDDAIKLNGCPSTDDAVGPIE